MKKALLICISLFFSLTIHANESYFVTAKNGLIVRDAPSFNANKIGKIPHKHSVGTIEESNVRIQIKDGGKIIKGQWVKVESDIFLYEPDSSVKASYVFSGYLEKLNKIDPINVTEIDELAFNKLYKETEGPYRKKITSQKEAEKLIGSKVTWRNDISEELSISIILPNGHIFKTRPSDLEFSAYYPNEDILLFQEGHGSDFSLSLRTGETTATVGNPEYIIESPSKKRRLNGLFDGFECSSYFFQEKDGGHYSYLRSFSWEEYIEKNESGPYLCSFKTFHWLDDDNFIFSHIVGYANGKEVHKYFRGLFKK